MINKESINLCRSFVNKVPQDAAKILEQYDPKDVGHFLKYISIKERAILFQVFLDDFAAKIAGYVSDSFFSSIIELLEVDQQVSIMRGIEIDRRVQILSRLSSNQSIHIKSLLHYDSFEVGGSVNSRVLCIPIDYTVQDAINRISNTQDEFLCDPIYIIDRDKTVQGKISVFNLFKSVKNASITGFMDPCSATLLDTMKLDNAMQHPAWRIEDAMPVTNKDHKFIGVLLYRNMIQTLNIFECDFGSTGGKDLVTELMLTYTKILENMSEKYFF